LSRITAGYHRKFYGPSNEELGDEWGGMLSYEAMIDVLAHARVFAYHGTYPASYTLALMEAMCAGVPLVTPGPTRGNGTVYRDQKPYEAHRLLEGTGAVCTDDLSEARNAVGKFLRDPGLAADVSAAVRERASELWDVRTIGPQWQELLGSL
jgi:glycosyltransferase involved in cell wall biosynthesis